MSTLETPGDGNKRLFVISYPPDVKDTVSLTYAYGLEPDDQWIYLPALRRTKRPNARDKAADFIGSEFAFADPPDDGGIGESAPTSPLAAPEGDEGGIAATPNEDAKIANTEVPEGVDPCGRADAERGSVLG